MKAIRIERHGGPEVLQCVDIAQPVPAAGEVLVRAHTIGVGKPDVLVRSGLYRWNQTLPVVIGHEMAGHIVALGEGVTDFEIGQSVLVITAAGGGYAEYAAVPTRSVIALPRGMDVERAVGALNYMAAWVFLHEMGQIKAGQTLYLNGASGGLGTAVIQLARLAEVTVIAGASTEEKCAFARSQGAAHTINYSRETTVERVNELTAGKGVHLILDQFVGPHFGLNFDMLATLGQVLVYNWTGGLPTQNVIEVMGAHIAKSPALRVFSLHCYDNDVPKRRALFNKAIDLLAAGKVQTPISQRLGLAQARYAHELLDAGKVFGKILLKPPG